MPRGDDEEEDYSRAIKKFQRQRDDGLFKLLQENKRFNSETENVLAQEYENL